MRNMIRDFLMLVYKLPWIINGVQWLNRHFNNLYFLTKFHHDMTKNLKPSSQEILKFNNEDFKNYIFLLQDNLQEKLKSGLTIDEILDIEDPFESLEPFLPEEVYPIMVLAMINNIRSDTVLDALTEGFNNKINDYKKKNAR